MKLYILITLFIFMYIFLTNTSFSQVKDEFVVRNNVTVNRAQTMNKIIENQLAFIEYYIGRSDAEIVFDVKSRVSKHKDIIKYLNVLIDTIVDYNNKKFRGSTTKQYIRRVINSFDRKRGKDCVNYKINVMLYNTSNYITTPYTFEFCLKKNKFIINSIRNIDENIEEEEAPVIPKKLTPYNEDKITAPEYSEKLFKETNILEDLVAPKDNYETDIDKMDNIIPCDLTPAKNKNFDWHPSYLQINDIDHKFDYIVPRDIIIT